MKLFLATIVLMCVSILGAPAMAEDKGAALAKAMNESIAKSNASEVHLRLHFEDVDGKPIAGIPVKCSCQLNVASFQPGSDKQEPFTLTSDVDGNVNETRKCAQINVGAISKDGYQFFPENSFHAAPDSAGVTTITGWRIGPGDWVMHRQYLISELPRRDGQTYTIDLLDATIKRGKQQDGDLWITGTEEKPPANGAISGSVGWTWLIEAVDGGVVATKDVFPCRPPTEGYQKSIQITGRKEMPLSDAERSVFPHFAAFYVHCRGGKAYASGVLEGHNGKLSGMQTYLNPTGRPNLEPAKNDHGPPAGDPVSAKTYLDALQRPTPTTMPSR